MTLSPILESVVIVVGTMSRQLKLVSVCSGIMVVAI